MLWGSPGAGGWVCLGVQRRVNPAVVPFLLILARRTRNLLLPTPPGLGAAASPSSGVLSLPDLPRNSNSLCLLEGKQSEISAKHQELPLAAASLSIPMAAPSLFGCWTHPSTPGSSSGTKCLFLIEFRIKRPTLQWQSPVLQNHHF